jgi:hypothetical protein
MTELRTIIRYATLPFRLLVAGMVVLLVWLWLGSFRQYRCKACGTKMVGGRPGQSICPDCDPSRDDDPSKPAYMR